MQVESDADPGWVGALAGVSDETARTALEEAADQSRLFRHLQRQHAKEGRRSYIEIDAPLELHAIARLLRPRHALEVGVSSGVSSAYLLNALKMNGRGTLHSVDLPSFPRAPKRGKSPTTFSWTLPEGRDSGWAIPGWLRTRWDLRLGDKAEVVPRVAEEFPGFELVLYDVPHDDRKLRGEFRPLAPRLMPGGAVIVDHGPGGGLCPALASWARSVGARPVRRAGLGLYGFRSPPRRNSPRTSRAGTQRRTSLAGRGAL
ncbi:MAG TPA: class I SAM-dependent methyltransferase [Thermoplasmata archaeon]|nr:class I SAM-dependent methyltransferase [Thermoplasmata archaeon]